MTEAELYSVYKDVYLPHAVYSPESLKHYEEFSFRPDDVIIVTYPKSGKWVSQVTLQVSLGHHMIKNSMSAEKKFAM